MTDDTDANAVICEFSWYFVKYKTTEKNKLIAKPLYRSYIIFNESFQI